MSGTIIKTVFRIAKAVDAELNFRRKYLANIFGLAGMLFIPQAVSTKFNIYDQFSAWNGRNSARECSRIYSTSALSAEDIFSGFLKLMRCLTEHKLL